MSITGWLQISKPYRDKFGFFAGMKMGWKARQLLWVLPRNSIVRIKLPNMRYPIGLRAQTTDLGTFHQVFLDEEHAIDLDTAPQTICDLGANVGLASIYFANRFPNAKIIAIEPERENFLQLKANTAAYENIEIIHGAAWPRDTNLSIVNTDKGSNAFQVKETTIEEEVDCVGISIPTILENFAKNRIDLLKMDIEGSELDLFADQESLQNWITKIGVLMVELHDRDRSGCREAFNHATKTACRKLTRGEFDIAYFTNNCTQDESGNS